MRVSNWLKLAAFIVFIEVRHCRDGRLLSEEADALVARRPILGRAAIWTVGLTLTAHVANCLDWHIDPLSQRFWRRFCRSAP